MKLIKNKYFSSLLIACIALMTWYLFSSKYQDWSELNDLVEKECIIRGKAKENCLVDFHKLNFKWDDVYWIRGGQGEEYVSNTLGKKNIIRLQSGQATGTYFVFLKNKKIVKIYEQLDYFFSFWHDDGVENNNNNILLLKDRKGKAIDHCENKFLLTKTSNDYEGKKDRIVYLISCLK